MQPEGLDKLPVIAYGRSLGASLAVHAGAHARLLPMRVCGVIVESGLMEWASLPVVQVHCSIAALGRTVLVLLCSGTHVRTY